MSSRRNGSRARRCLAVIPVAEAGAIARARNEDQVVISESYLMSKGGGAPHRPEGPVVMEPVRAEIRLKSEDAATVHLLDHTGVQTGRTLPVENGLFRIDTGRDQTPYYLITFD